MNEQITSLLMFVILNEKYSIWSFYVNKIRVQHQQQTNTLQSNLNSLMELYIVYIHKHIEW